VLALVALVALPGFALFYLCNESIWCLDSCIYVCTANACNASRPAAALVCQDHAGIPITRIITRIWFVIVPVVQ